MKTFLKSLVAVGAVAIALLITPSASAQCINCDHDMDCDCDGVLDSVDNCPTVPNPTQSDLDLDGVGNDCDNCPTIPNSDQNPAVCDQRVENITCEKGSPAGGDTGIVSCTTTHEFDLVGINVVLIDAQGTRTQQSTRRCEECVTGLPHSYSFIITKHKNCQNLFIEMMRLNGTVQLFGPAVLIKPNG